MSITNSESLKSGSRWSEEDITDMGFNFAHSVQDIYPYTSAGYTGFLLLAGFHPLGSSREFSNSSNPNDFDQQDIVNFFLVDPDDIQQNPSDYVDMNNVLKASIDYRVSFGDVINANFTERNDAEINLVNVDGWTNSVGSDPVNSYAIAQLPDESYEGLISFKDTHDIFQNSNVFEPGKVGFQTIIHELGHAIGGLLDTHKTNLHETTFDNQHYTIMSYNQVGTTYASGLQLLDIAAIQDTYGNRNYETRSSDTVYSLGNGLGFDGHNQNDGFLYTIWDGGGIDTLDASDFTNSAAYIDLRQGSFSSIGITNGSSFSYTTNTNGDLTGVIRTDNVAISYYTVIERAIGTQNNDVIIGNAWNNELIGGAGDDFIFGYGPDGNEEFHEIDPFRHDGKQVNASENGNSDDILFGGDGYDKLYGGGGNDTLIASTSDDILNGGENDAVFTGKLAERAFRAQLREQDGYGGDTADFANMQDGWHANVDLSAGTASVFDASGNQVATHTLINIENVQDTKGSDEIIGSDENNILIHSGGSDIYDAMGGDDLVILEKPKADEYILVNGNDGDDTVRIAGSIGIVKGLNSRSIGIHGVEPSDPGDLNDVDESDYTREWVTTTIDGQTVDVLEFTHKVTGGVIALVNVENIQFEDGAYIDRSVSNKAVVHEGADAAYYSNGIPGHDGEGLPDIEATHDPATGETTLTFEDSTTGETLTVTSGNHVVHVIPGLPKLWVEGGKFYWYPDFSDIPGFKSPDDSPAGDFPEAPPEDDNEPEPDENPEEADDVKDVEDAVDQSEATGSPLVLDLDGDGIELTSLEGSSVYWDLDEDGFAESTGWVAADDGFLAIDLDGNGLINSHEELFGSITEDGFTALSVYDTNADGVIDINDAQFNDLVVWRDLNQNGVSGANELQSLSDLNIVSIDLNAAQPHQYYLEGHHISHTSTYTTDDGVNGPQTHDIVDAWFQYDNLISLYNKDFDLDPHTFSLPNMRGYGDMPTLQIAMSLDNDQDNPESLMSLMQAFTDRDFTDYFADDGSVMQDIRTIMLRWSGADQIEAGSRGLWADAQELVYLETFLGDQYLQYGGNPNPGSLASASANRAFEVAMLPVAGRIISQAVAEDLFEGDLIYDANTDSFSGFTGFKQDALDMLVAKSVDGTVVQDKAAFWIDVVRVIKHSVGIDNLSSSDYDQLEAALIESDEFLTVQQIIDKMQHDIDVHETWVLTGESVAGTSDNDVYNGTVGDDHFSGSYGDDTINGGIGDDLIYGGSGNDIINGGLGDDDLRGDHNDDTYLFFRGHGDDVIYETSGNDRILFDEGITADDVVLTRVGAYDLKISLNPSVGAGSATVIGHFSGGILEILEFADGTTLDLTSLDYTYQGSDENETIYGVRQGLGGSGVDTLYGNGGDDAIYAFGPSGGSVTQNELYGGDGNDTLFGENYGDLLDGGADDDTINGGSGADTVIGGTGDDQLNGGWGDDVYIFNYGDGNDIIADTRGTSDILKFGEGITFEMLNIYRVNNFDVMIEIDGGNGGSVLLSWQTYSYVIETLEFHDGSTVAMTSLNLTLNGTDENETLQGVGIGASQIDTIYGHGGNDIIYGNASNYSSYEAKNYLFGGDGNDTLYADRAGDELYGETGDDILNGNSANDLLIGGTGDDQLNGGWGDDVYIFNYGDGNDIIADTRGTTDILKFGEGITFEMLNIYRVNNFDVMIEIDGGNGGSVLLSWQTYSYVIETLEFHDGSTVAMTSLELTLSGTDGNDTLQGVRIGASQIDTIYGEDGDDIIYGYQTIADYNNNFLYGGSGNDKIYASHGEDYIEGNDGNDLIYGYSGSDEVYGGEGADKIYGGNQNDILYGGEGNDILYGENNDDLLIGGLGADTLTGGGGYDTFVFNADSSFDAVDTITDFSALYDTIDISDILSAYDPINDALTDFVQITDDGSDSTLSVDIDGGGDNFVAIALIDNRTGLTDVDDLVANGRLVTV